MALLAPGLFRKHALWISGIVAATALISGSLQAYFTYRETNAAFAGLHAFEAYKAAARIDAFILGVIGELRATLNLLETGHANRPQDLKLEAYRLLKQSPAIAEVRYLDGTGIEQVHVSRFGFDGLELGQDRSRSAVFSEARPHVAYVSAVYFYKDSEPRATIGLRAKPPHDGVLCVEVNLKHIWQVIEQIKVGSTGFAYIVDENGYLIAHPDIALVLRKTAFPGLAHAVVPTARTDSRQARMHEFTDADGRAVVSSFVALAVPSWTLFIQQQRSEAYAPLVDSLVRSGFLLGGALLLGLLASVVMARQVTKPVAALSAGAKVIGHGNLSHRIALATNDELSDLAAEFNRMADRLRDSYTHLERKVEERTHELAKANRLILEQAEKVRGLNAELNSRLIELAAQKEEAERANAGKTRFLAAASHDLRQPMHSIGLLVGILGQRKQHPEMRDVVQKLQSSVRAMEALFNTLLDISKLDSGIIKPNVQEFELDSLLASIASNYLPQAKQRRLALRYVHSSATVRSDPVLLERIVGNLVANAIRYTERGKVLIGTRRRRGCVAVQVWDTGIGIREDHLDAIFDEFFQVENPERDREKGLGLGLSIVKRSAELLGHPIVVQSRIGVGTVFTVEVPAVAWSKAPAYSHRREFESLNQLGGSFVLIIDDDVQNRFAMEASFKSWGCHVVSAGSSAEALDGLRGHLRAPDLIVSDYRLRDRWTGLQAIREVREFAEIDIPAVIVTGDVAIGDLRQHAGGRLAILHKPVRSEQLLETAARLLELEASPG